MHLCLSTKNSIIKGGERVTTPYPVKRLTETFLERGVLALVGQYMDRGAEQ